MRIHASVKIVAYLLCLISLNFLTQTSLIAFCVFSFFFALLVEGKKFLHRCFRLRWLFLSILIIYAFTVPGQYFDVFGTALLTIEGVSHGLLRVAHLLIAIATLGILFAKVKAVELVSGLFLLLKPLQCLGVDVNRLVVRLMLSLQYVDHLTLTFHTKWMFSDVFCLFESVEHEHSAVDLSLECPSLNMIDLTLLGLSLVVLSLVVTL